MDPADQGLDPHDATALELDHRLVVQPVLLVFDRALQVRLELQALERGVVHRGLEDLVAALPPFLRHVHRDVGVAQQLLHIASTVAVRGRDADRRPHEHLLALEGERVLEHRHDAFGDVGGRHSLFAVLEQHGELVAPEPGGGVRRPQARAQPLPDLEEQLVSGRVPKRVVDRLEVVEVHEQHRDRRVVAELSLEGVGDAVVEQRPVREGRDGVVEGLVFELFLEALALGHVTDVQHDASDVGVVRLIGDERLRVQMLPTVVPHPQLDQHRVPRLLVVRFHRVERLRYVVGVHELGEPGALQGLRVVAEHACDRGADVADRGVPGDHADDIGRVAHERGEPRLALLLEQVPGEGGRLQRERDLGAQRGQRVGERPVHLVGGRDDHQPPELVLYEQGAVKTEPCSIRAR